MVAIKNIQGVDLSLSLDGTDYKFPSGSIVLVEEKIVERIREIWPLAFEFDIPVTKKSVVSKPRVSKTEGLFTKSVTDDGKDMKVTRSGIQTSTFTPDSEVQGDGFYGAGVELDNLME